MTGSIVRRTSCPSVRADKCGRERGRSACGLTAPNDNLKAGIVFCSVVHPAQPDHPKRIIVRRVVRFDLLRCTAHHTRLPDHPFVSEHDIYNDSGVLPFGKFRVSFSSLRPITASVHHILLLLHALVISSQHACQYLWASRVRQVALSIFRVVSLVRGLPSFVAGHSSGGILPIIRRVVALSRAKTFSRVQASGALQPTFLAVMIQPIAHRTVQMKAIRFEQPLAAGTGLHATAIIA